MAKFAVNEIILCEDDAAEIIAKAEASAKELISEAEKAGRALVLETEAAMHKKVRELLDAIDSENAAALSGNLSRQADEAAKLAALAEGRMEKAATLIVERVVKG